MITVAIPCHESVPAKAVCCELILSFLDDLGYTCEDVVPAWDQAGGTALETSFLPTGAGLRLEELV